MKGKTYIVSTISIVLVLLIAVGTFTVVIDPLFQYHKPWFGMKPVVDDDRYQVAGMAKTFEYDTVIMGNSMSENFRVSDVDHLIGGNSIKLTISGSRALEWSYLLSIVQEKKPKCVLLNIDPSTFAASSTEFEHDFPTYLYDKSLCNDVNYLLNFSIINKFALSALQKNKLDETTDMDTLFMWDNKFASGKEIVLESYERKAYSNEIPDIKAYCNNIDANLELLSKYISEMKETTFVIFFSPYSMLFWDEQERNNQVLMQKEGYLEATRILLKHDNVLLYLWNDTEMLQIMSNLDNYKDANHYNGTISKEILNRISMKKGLLTNSNASKEIDKLFEYIENYDYERLFI